MTTHYYYAASTQFSGVAGFPTEAEREAWLKENKSAFAIDRRQVDPEIRQEFESE